MAHLSADYTLTFEEFAEAYRAHRRRKKFLSGRPERSPLVGCAWLAGLFVLVLVATVVAIYWTGHTVAGANGRTQVESDSPVVQGFLSLLVWIVVVGFFWLVVSRAAPIERRIAGRGTVLLLLFGACSSFVSVMANPPPAPAGPPSPADNGQALLSLLPWAVLLVGIPPFFFYIVRQTIRLSWDGQPHLREPLHLDASDERLTVATRLMRTEYDWTAFISRTETDNVFVLFVSALGFHTIPKRGFATVADVDAFRELLALKVPADVPRPHGFDVKATAPAAAQA